jgi:hypothetical protein
MVGFTRPWHGVLERGCGGGANAVHFAQRATEFVGVGTANGFSVSPGTCSRPVGSR